MLADWFWRDFLYLLSVITILLAGEINGSRLSRTGENHDYSWSRSAEPAHTADYPVWHAIELTACHLYVISNRAWIQLTISVFLDFWFRGRDLPRQLDFLAVVALRGSSSSMGRYNWTEQHSACMSSTWIVGS